MNHSEHYVFLGYSMKKTVGKGVQWEENMMQGLDDKKATQESC